MKNGMSGPFSFRWRSWPSSCRRSSRRLPSRYSPRSLSAVCGWDCSSAALPCCCRSWVADLAPVVKVVRSGPRAAAALLAGLAADSTAAVVASGAALVAEAVVLEGEAAAAEAAGPRAAGRVEHMKAPAMIKELPGWAGLAGQWLRRRHFTHEVLAHIAERIRQCERDHSGELVVAIEAASPIHERDTRMRALEVFGRLCVWDTPESTGVLLYLALDRHRIEIIADRGVPASNEEWEAVCARLKLRLAEKDYAQGILAAIDDIEAIMRRHCARVEASDDDATGTGLSNDPVLL